MKELPLLLYPKQAQQLIGVKATKFYELQQTSCFPKPRALFGKRPMYLREELERWVKELT